MWKQNEGGGQTSSRYISCGCRFKLDALLARRPAVRARSDDGTRRCKPQATTPWCNLQLNLHCLMSGLRMAIRLVTFDALHTLVAPRLPVYVQYSQTFEPYLGVLDPDALKHSFKIGT